MRVRYLLFVLWAGITLFLVVTALSDFIFGNRDARRLLQRLVLAVIWPIAMLSEAGRNVLFNRGVVR